MEKRPIYLLTRNLINYWTFLLVIISILTTKGSFKSGITFISVI